MGVDPSSVALPSDTFSYKGEGKGHARLDHAASTRRKPFHIAVAAPEVSTGRSRSS
jgi:hypothetical protein